MINIEKENEYMHRKSTIKGMAAWVVFFCMGLAVSLTAGCDKQAGASKEVKISAESIAFTTEYQAIFMDNGQTFFGKLEKAGSAYPVLTDVFYIRQQVNQDTKEVKNILIKRGSEWHGPDRMYINAAHIAIIEPVAPGSQVARLISEAHVQKPAAGQQ